MEKIEQVIEINKIVGEGIGEASMCWSETPKGVFDSERASKITDKIVAFHNKEIQHYKDQIDELANYIMKHHSDFIIGEGACHTAVKIMKKLKWKGGE